MKIKLICPSFYDLNDNVYRPKTALLPPLSVFYLAGFVPKEHEVSALDDAVDEINYDDAVDLVGITTTTTNARRAYEIADTFREKGVRVVMGGIHASLLSDEALQHADSVVQGEAEDAWPELIQDVLNGALKRIYKGVPRESLAGLPLPRFDLINKKRYFVPPFGRSPIIPIYTSRGCPHNCSFCSVTKYWGKKLRLRPIPEVIEEIKLCGSKTLFITDDNFLANPKRAMEFCEALEPLGVKFICQIDTITKNREDVYKMMGRAGCFLAFIGFERIDENKLSQLNKRFNSPDDYTHLINSLHKNSINVYASLILGLSGDNPSIARNGVNFLIKNHVEIAAFFPITPFPGTDFFDDLEKSGFLIDDKWWLHSVKGKKEGLVNYLGNDFTEYDLCRMAMKDFYSLKSLFKRYWNFRPYRLLPFILNFHSRIKAREAKDVCVL